MFCSESQKTSPQAVIIDKFQVFFFGLSRLGTLILRRMRGRLANGTVECRRSRSQGMSGCAAWAFACMDTKQRRSLMRIDHLFLLSDTDMISLISGSNPTQLQTPEAGHSGLEARVVVRGHFVGHVVLPAVHVLVVLVGPAHQRPVEHLGVGIGAVEVAPVAGRGSRGAGAGAVVRPAGRIPSEADHEAAAAVSQHVVDLLPCKRAVDVWGDVSVGRYEGQEGDVRSVAVGAPFISPGQSFGCVLDAVTGEPAVEEALDGLHVCWLPGELCEEKLNARSLVVPGESPGIATQWVRPVHTLCLL